MKAIRFSTCGLCHGWLVNAEITMLQNKNYQCNICKRNAGVRDNPVSAHKYKESPETYSPQSFHVPLFIFIHFLPA